MPAVSKKQFKFFKSMQSNPKEAKAKGISPTLANEYTEGMTSARWKRLKNKIKTK